MLIESCRAETDAGDPPADAAFSDLLASMGVGLEEIQPGHELLLEPYLFAAPPPGFETGGEARVLVGEGVIFSTCDFGCLWRGQRRGAAASREEIRTGVEWGDNIVHYALKRRQGKGGA